MKQTQMPAIWERNNVKTSGDENHGSMECDGNGDGNGDFTADWNKLWHLDNALVYWHTLGANNLHISKLVEMILLAVCVWANTVSLFV